MNTTKNNPLCDYHPFLLWMTLIGFILFAFWLGWREGWMIMLLTLDKSNISAVILLLFTIMSLHSGFHNFKISQQLNLLATKNSPKPFSSHSSHSSQTETSLHDTYEIGWFMVDVLIKLGLLGTVVGFIIMLSSLGSITRLDIEVAQKLMVEMGSGMGIALYTTLTGLVSAIFLSGQYYILESTTHHFIALEKGDH